MANKRSKEKNERKEIKEEIRKARKEEMSPERYFLMYAYPCSFVLVDLGKITEAKRKELEKKLLKNEPISKQELEKIFASAFRRLKQIAKETERDYWDFSVLRKYWLEEHNRFIDSGDGEYGRATSSFRELCKVHKAEVLTKEENILTVQYDHTKRKVFATLVPETKKGDKITVHLAFAIERID